MTSTNTLNDDHYYTRTIIGERLVLTLGRPLVSHAGVTPFQWKSNQQPHAQPSKWIRWSIGVGFVIVAPLLVYAGMHLSAFIQSPQAAGGGELPVALAGNPKTTVRVIDQEYTPPQTFPIGVARPSPLPDDHEIGGMPVPLNPPSPVAAEAIISAAKTKPKEQGPTEKPASSVVVDDGPVQKAVEPAPKKVEPPVKAVVEPPKQASAKPVQPPSPVLPTPAVKGVDASVKLAKPVEEKPAVAAQVNAKAPAAAAAPVSPTGSKITLVDIPPGGKSVLVTNPANRLPTRLSVGDKLPNGQTIQSIDEKSGSITADGSTYKLD